MGRHTLIDYNVRAERMGWLPSAPQLETNPLTVAAAAAAAGEAPADYVAARLKSGEIRMSCEDPDDPRNWPRNLFVWRSTCSARAARGTSTSSSTCWERATACMGKDLGATGGAKPSEVTGTTRRRRASSTFW